MPVLQNQRYELFCQAIARGETTSKAYETAGFRPSRSNAARLRANERVGQRILELQSAAADSCKISIQSVCRELDEAIALAKAKGQPNALVSAANLRAKLGGLLVEKQQVEITSDDPYVEMNTAEEILAQVAEDLGVEVARALAAAFGLAFDEATITAFNSPNGSHRGHNQRMIEERKPVAARKHDI